MDFRVEIKEIESLSVLLRDVKILELKLRSISRSLLFRTSCSESRLRILIKVLTNRMLASTANLLLSTLAAITAPSSVKA